MLSRQSLIISRSLKSFKFSQVREMSELPKGFIRENPTYTERQDHTGRPVSPHVTTYAFPVVAISSIINRVTGVGLWGGKITRNLRTCA